jgi:protein-serine/threonine kinase
VHLPDAARDPLPRDEVHGQKFLDVRKAFAFAGFTHRSARTISYVAFERGA